MGGSWGCRPFCPRQRLTVRARSSHRLLPTPPHAHTHRRITQEAFQTAGQKGRLFDFNERVIFGRFDLLIRRLNKLKSLFELVHQYKLLSEYQVRYLRALVD
jgi:hypothetical protein